MTYTPDKTAVYENLVKLSYIQQCGTTKLEAPIGAEITAVFPIPKSTSKKRKLLMLAEKAFHIHKPDCDNVAKAILDSLNDVAYADDSGIAKLSIEKIYGETPEARVTLTELEGEKP